MSEENGIIFGYYIDHTQAKKVSNFKRASTTANQDGFLWLHLDGTNKHAKDWLKSSSGLSVINQTAILSDDTRPRLVNSDEGLLLNLRGLNLNPDRDEEDMVSLHMWIESKRIITLRNEKVFTIEDIKNDIEKGRGPTTIDNFLKRVIEGLTSRISDYVSYIEDQVDNLEESVVTSESHELRSSLSEMRREIIMIRRYIVPQRDVLARLQIETLGWLGDLDRLYIREFAERTARLVEELDLIRDRAALTQEELNNRISDQMNRNMYMLSIIGSIFLPLSFLTGLFGINIGGMPGVNSSYAFLIFSLIMIIITFIELLFFKRNKWL